MKKEFLRATLYTFALAVSATLFACGDNDDESSSLTSDIQTLVNAGEGFSNDSVIYLADSVKFIDKLTQIADFGEEDPPSLTYSAKAMASAIHIGLQVFPDMDGGTITVSCHPNQAADLYQPSQSPKIAFSEPKFPAKNSDGYKLDFKDSLKAGDSVYYDVLHFSVPDSGANLCSISAFYYGIHDGVIKVVSKNGVELNRVPASAYEEAQDRREKERAMADSIAQAVADSIIEANTPAADDSTNGDNKSGDDSQIEIPQEVIDLADSVAECIKRAYEAGSLSALKDCEI